MFQVLVWSKARIKPSPLKPSFSQFRKCLRHKIANLFILSRLAFKMFMNALLFQLNFYYELKMEIAFLVQTTSASRPQTATSQGSINERLQQYFISYTERHRVREVRINQL